MPGTASGYNIALVGASTLKGKELREVLAARAFPARKLTLLDEEDVTGQLTDFHGEPTFIRRLERQSFEGADLAFFAGEPSFTQQHWQVAAGAGAAVMDVTEALDTAPGVRLAGPLAAGELPAGEGRVLVGAHPAALAISVVLRRLAERCGLARAIINVFEPVSERGAAGVDELHQQTVSLLSFQQVPQKVFDSQVAFNLLAAWGEQSSRPTLAEVEERIDRHVQALLGSVPRPSIRLAQAPIFHGYAFTFYVELDGPRPVGAIEQAFEGAGFDLRRPGVEAPSPVGAASSEEIVIGDIRADRASDRGYWLWAAVDNLRLMALNAVRTAELVLAGQ